MQFIANDFSIGVISVNGTGSQSANTLLTKCLMRMGLNVAPKNHFPSNIQGVPTSFEIRLSRKGFLCAKENFDIIVLMNPNTFEADLNKYLRPGVAVFFNDCEAMKIPAGANGIFYPIPVDRLAQDSFPGGRSRVLMKNMIILGTLMECLSVDEAITKEVVVDTFSKKPDIRNANQKAIDVGREFFRSKLKKQDPFRCEKEIVHRNKILADGNTLSALGALVGGCTVAAWYPITPSSTIMETLEEYFEKYRTTSNGKRRSAIVQCEDEIASAGIIVGAGYAGARSLTATSGPGISLMSEIIGLAYYTETPCVFINVQRVGPSTGLPTRTQQGDLLSTAFIGHGDTRHPMLFPHDPTECYEMTMLALDYADRFQTPIFLMMDLDVGMNVWMTDAPAYPNRPTDRGKILSYKDLDRIETFKRYSDVDQDGIPYRTLPGNEHPLAPYFIRGTSHDENAKYTESPEVYERVMARLRAKWQTMKQTMIKPVEEVNQGSDTGIIAYGTSHYATLEAIDHFTSQDIPLDYLRVRAFPFAREVGDFISRHKHVIVIDQNIDGQLQSLIRMEMPLLRTELSGIAISNGFPLSATRLIPKMEDVIRRSTPTWTKPKTASA